MEKSEFYIQNMNSYILQEKKNLNKEIGEKLKEKRIEKKISLIKLGEETSTSPTYLSQIERGEYGISLLKFILICNALEINIIEFLDEFIFSETTNEDILFEKLQEDKNISSNILEFIKEKQ